MTPRRHPPHYTIARNDNQPPATPVDWITVILGMGVFGGLAYICLVLA